MKWLISSKDRNRDAAPASPQAGNDLSKSVQSLIESTRRDLAMLISQTIGLQSYPGQFDKKHGPLRLALSERRLFRDLVEEAELPYLVIDPRPGLRIVDLNDAYAAATLTRRSRTAGNRMFDTFPDNPQLPQADGVSNLFESLQRAAQSGQPHTMGVQRYDILDAHGHFVERYWRPVNTPIFDEAGRVIYLLHHVVDVTDQMRRPGAAPGGLSRERQLEAWRQAHPLLDL